MDGWCDGYDGGWNAALDWMDGLTPVTASWGKMRVAARFATCVMLAPNSTISLINIFHVLFLHQLAAQSAFFLEF